MKIKIIKIIYLINTEGLHMIKSKIKKFYINNNGVTLVELMIALSLVSLTIVLIYNFFFTGLNAYRMVNDQTDVQFRVRRVANEIADDLRNAEDLSATTSGNNSISIENYFENTYDDSYITLSLSGSTLSIEVYAEKNNRSYSVNEDIMLNNLNLENYSGSMSSLTLDYSTPLKVLHYNLPDITSVFD